MPDTGELVRTRPKPLTPEEVERLRRQLFPRPVPRPSLEPVGVPSFGLVHSTRARPAGTTSDRSPRPCRPRRNDPQCPHGRSLSCTAPHQVDDSLLGQPFCRDSASSGCSPTPSGGGATRTTSAVCGVRSAESFRSMDS